MMKRFYQLMATAFISPVLLNLTISNSVQAENQFDVCLKQIVNSGVNVEQANTACADALIPKELSYCVSQISTQTQVVAEDALKNCYQVRRPVDMANCVVDIDNKILKNYAPSTNSQTETSAEETDTIEITSNTIDQESPLMLALETCRSTIAPDRHSECVIALSRTPQPMSPVKAMNTCISAEDFPKDLFSDS